MQYVEEEVAKVLAADPALEAARQRAVRRSGRTTAHRRTAHDAVATH